MTTQTGTANDERYVARRTVPASPAAVFALLSDPARHPETEPTDWVRAAIDPQPITEVGQIFGMDMFMAKIGGPYVMHNQVVVLVPDRSIAWAPGQYDGQGTWRAGGWTWRYDLEPADAGTTVTLTYDWSATPQAVRDEIGTPPPFPPEFLDQSLASLEHAVR